MKRILVTITSLTLSAGLTACDKPEPQAAASANSDMATSQPAPADSMAGMDMTADATMAKGTGTVTAVDNAAGTITIDHGSIPEAKWPAMTMAFKAAPAVIAGVKKGDKVDFDLKLQDGAGEVIAIHKPAT